MTEPVPQPLRYLVAAWLFVAVVALVVFNGIVPQYPAWLTGVIAWVACALLWPRLSRTQVRIVLALVAFGAAGVVWGMASGKSGLVQRALGQNIPLVGMLIAVSFLQLISTTRSTE
ncbi:MAG: hypothetical protein Q8L40_02965, partial [Burkholderiales bacterium]|nr:hypothetical protein [Burkholderiales bacterium]